MQFFYLVIIVVALVIVKAVYDEKTRKMNMHFKLKNQWGQYPEEEYTEYKWNTLSSYYESIKDEKTDVDDITWNDLNMDEIYQVINNTGSAMGEEYLYAVLRKPVFDEAVLKERNRIIEFFSENEEERINVQSALKTMGKFKNISVFEYINITDRIESKNKWIHYLSAVALIVSLLMIFINPVYGGLLTFVFVSFNMLQYYKCKAIIEKYYNVFSYILRMIYGIKKLIHLDINEINEYTEQLIDADKSFKKFKRGSFIVFSGKDGQGSLVDVLLDYLRMLFHIDLIKFYTMVDEVKNNREILNIIFKVIGQLDSDIAIASFREYLGGNYCLPELEKTNQGYMELENVFHPLIENPVLNSLNEKKSVLLTGSNASGKSTFLKTVAINTILAQTIYTGLCTRYKASYFKIFSSMALQDNIFENESYYIVEIKSLKRILEHIDDTIPMLCFIDEVLRGTNTLERIASSSQILNNIANNNAICFAATHDIELTYILEEVFSNYHFQEEVVENDVLFDYLLYQGRATSRNAIKLLSILGYSPKIIEKATKQVDLFVNTGTWSLI